MIITITKKPKLINYNNTTLTDRNIKIGHNVRKKINTQGKEKRPGTSMLKEYKELP